MSDYKRAAASSAASLWLALEPECPLITMWSPRLEAKVGSLTHLPALCGADWELRWGLQAALPPHMWSRRLDWPMSVQRCANLQCVRASWVAACRAARRAVSDPAGHQGRRGHTPPLYFKPRCLTAVVCLHTLCGVLQGTKAEAQAVVDAASRAMVEAPRVRLGGSLGSACAACAGHGTAAGGPPTHARFLLVAAWPGSACRSDRAAACCTALH